MGLSRPLADACTVLRYGMGELARAVAGPRRELVGCAIPVSVLHPAERGACLDVVLSAGVLPSLHGATPEVVPAPPATCQVLFPSFFLQTLRDGRLLWLLAGAAPPGLVLALQAFFPWRRLPGGPTGGG